MTSEASTTASCVADSCSSAATLIPDIVQRPSVVHRGSWYDHHRTPAHAASSQTFLAQAWVDRTISRDDLARPQPPPHEARDRRRGRARSGRRARRSRRACVARRVDGRAGSLPSARTTRTPRRRRRRARRSRRGRRTGRCCRAGAGPTVPARTGDGRAGLASPVGSTGAMRQTITPARCLRTLRWRRRGRAGPRATSTSTGRAPERWGFGLVSHTCDCSGVITSERRAST